MVARTLEEMRASGMDVLVGASPATLADLADYRNWIDPLFREYMDAPRRDRRRPSRRWPCCPPRAR